MHFPVFHTQLLKSQVNVDHPSHPGDSVSISSSAQRDCNRIDPVQKLASYLSFPNSKKWAGCTELPEQRELYIISRRILKHSAFRKQKLS